MKIERWALTLMVSLLVGGSSFAEGPLPTGASGLAGAPPAPLPATLLDPDPEPIPTGPPLVETKFCVYTVGFELNLGGQQALPRDFYPRYCLRPRASAGPDCESFSAYLEKKAGEDCKESIQVIAGFLQVDPGTRAYFRQAEETSIKLAYSMQLRPSLPELRPACQCKIKLPNAMEICAGVPRSPMGPPNNPWTTCYVMRPWYPDLPGVSCPASVTVSYPFSVGSFSAGPGSTPLYAFDAPTGMWVAVPLGLQGIEVSCHNDVYYAAPPSTPEN